MRNYKKLRLIQKGEMGLTFNSGTVAGSALPQSVIDTVNKQKQNFLSSGQGLNLSQGFGQLFNQYGSQLFNAVSNYGITQGDSTLANLGQLGSSLNQGVSLINNWSKLANTDKASGVAGVTGQVANTLDNMFFSKLHNNDSALTKGLNNAYDTAAATAMKFSPVVGGAMYAGKLVGDGLSALGFKTDQMTTTDKVLDSNFMKLTPAGLVNTAFGKKSQDFSANNDTIEKVGSSYGGSVNTINEAVSKAGKKYGLFSNGARHSANRLINSARSQQNTMTNISNEYQDQLANKSDLAYTRYNMDINGGYQQQYIRAAKQGAILKRISLRKHKTGGELNCKINVDTKQLEWQPIINTELTIAEFKEGGELPIQEWQPIINTERPAENTEIIEAIVTMAEGGKTEGQQEGTKQETNQKNVIPEGALHAHKHHMEHDADITKKGIPVVDNKGEQQAEVEKNEIIFTLEVTKQLESFHEKFRNEESTQKEKDEAAIEAGKLLVYEILHNTEDRTGLIKECKKGGVLNEHK